MVRNAKADPNHYQKYFDARHLSYIMGGKHYTALAGAKCLLGTEADVEEIHINELKDICDERASRLHPSELFRHYRRLNSLAFREMGYVPDYW